MSKPTVGVIAAGVDMQLLAGGQFPLDDCAAAVHEHPAVAFQFLHDEALAAEDADADLLLEMDADGDPLCGAQEGVALGDQLAAHVSQPERQDRPRIGRREGDPGLPASLLGEYGHEQALAGQQPFAGRGELPEEALVGRRAVTEHGVDADRSGFEHHRAGFRDRALAGVEFDLHELHFVALDLVVDLVVDAGSALSGAQDAWNRAGHGCSCGLPGAAGIEGRCGGRGARRHRRGDQRCCAKR
jgi:hypothetical protein